MGCFTPTLSGFEILNDATLINRNLLVSRLFANIFHRLNFTEEHKRQFFLFFTIIVEYDFRRVHLMNFINLKNFIRKNKISRLRERWNRGVDVSDIALPVDCKMLQRKLLKLKRIHESL